MHQVIVGSSAAGTAAASAIRGADKSAAITLITADNAFFSRCQLHLLAAGERSAEQANFLPADWAATTGVEILWNTEVTGIKPAAHTVTTANGANFEYDRLLIASGSRSWTPPIPGITGELSFSLRTLEDAEQISAVLPFVQTVSIIGAGLVGVELAAELAQAGKRVNLVELAPHPLPLQLEEATGAKAAELLRSAGVELYCGRKVVGVQRQANDTPESLLLDDGQILPSDMLVTAAGVRPNIEWLEGSGIQTEPRGVLINEFAMTSAPDIYAAGDVTVMEDVLLRAVMPSPIWPTAVHQGRIAGLNMTGSAESLTRNTGYRSALNLLGTSVVSLGPVNKPDPGWDKELQAFTDSRGQECLKVLYRDADTLRAAILWGDISAAGVYADAIINRRPLPEPALAGALSGAKFGSEDRSIL